MPECDEPSSADELWIEFTILESEEIEGSIVLSPRNTLASKHVLVHLMKMSLVYVVTFMAVEAAPIYDRAR